jgi:hypothetical protein
MRTVVVVSKCVRARETGPRVWQGDFRFQGCYAGEEVRELHLVGPAPGWERGEEYVLYVKVMAITAGVMTGEVLRCRRLAELVSRR